MLIPRFWSKYESQVQLPNGKKAGVACWRASETSAAEAQALARAAGERFAERIRRGEDFPGPYPYGDRPLREEVLEDIPGPAGDVAAVLTRNGYGTVVLNTARVLFIDVDLPAAGAQFAPLRRLAHALLPFLVAPPRDPVIQALARLKEWLAARSGWGVRVYRTRAGLRYLVTHSTFEPGSGESEAAMAFLACDPAYVRLCKVQKSFRARLSPKPWRCGIERPIWRFPAENAAGEEVIREWVERYESASRGYATCELLASLGREPIHPEVMEVVRLHDASARVGSGLPLA